jgi:hypothetical protein
MKEIITIIIAIVFGGLLASAGYYWSPLKVQPDCPPCKEGQLGYTIVVSSGGRLLVARSDTLTIEKPTVISSDSTETYFRVYRLDVCEEEK